MPFPAAAAAAVAQPGVSIYLTAEPQAKLWKLSVFTCKQT